MTNNSTLKVRDVDVLSRVPAKRRIHFDRFSFKRRWRVILPILIVIVLIIIIARLVQCLGVQNTTQNNSKSFADILLALLPSAMTVCGAWMVAGWWQRRQTTIKFVEELHSADFHKIRFFLSEKMYKYGINDSTVAEKEFEDVIGWFPYIEVSSTPSVSIRSQDDFNADHALSQMVYYISRITTYDKHGLIQRTAAREMLHDFFAHYNVLLLEFANALRRVRRMNSNSFKDCQGWEDRADNICYFFTLIELPSKLPNTHKLVYFKLNGAAL